MNAARLAAFGALTLSLIATPGLARADSSSDPQVTNLDSTVVANSDGLYDAVQLTWTNPISLTSSITGLTVVEKPGSAAPATETEAGAVAAKLPAGTTSFTSPSLPEPGAHAFSVFVDYGDGTSSAPVTIAIDSAQITAFGGSTIDYGKPVTITGHVTDTQQPGTVLTGGTVRLLGFPHGSTSGAASAGSSPVSTEGYSVRLNPAQTYDFRALFMGDVAHLAALSAAVPVFVNPLVAVSFPKHPKHTKKFAVGIGLEPTVAGQTIQLQRQSGSKWVTIGTAKTDKNGGAAVYVKEKKGTFYYRVYAPGDNLHQAGAGPRTKVKIG